VFNKKYNPQGNAYIIAPHGFSSCFSKNDVNTSRDNINYLKLHLFLFVGIFKEHCAFRHFHTLEGLQVNISVQ